MVQALACGVCYTRPTSSVALAEGAHVILILQQKQKLSQVDITTESHGILCKQRHIGLATAA